MNKVLEVIKSRRSVRSYKPEQIKQEELDAIIEAAIHAPSGHNTQPWHFTVVQDPAVIRHISDVAKEYMARVPFDWIKNLGLNPDYVISYNAPTVIIVSGRKDAITWKTDCDAAIQNMLIAAESLDIGTVWLGFAPFCFRKEGEAEKIGVPEGYEPHYGVALGYKAKESQGVPKRNYDVVNYIR